MGTGYYGGFGKTYGYYFNGDASFMNKNEKFLEYIRKRNDVDPNGLFDIIAHGTSSSIQIEHNNVKIMINSRVASKLISRIPSYNGQALRLLSCNTGININSFAQHLANKLNVVVYAPTSYIWVNSNGKYYIAGKTKTGAIDLSKKGKFKKFIPGGSKYEMS